MRRSRATAHPAPNTPFYIFAPPSGSPQAGMRRLGSSPSERAQVKNTSLTRDGALPASQRLLFGGCGKGGLSAGLAVLAASHCPVDLQRGPRQGQGIRGGKRLVSRAGPVQRIVTPGHTAAACAGQVLSLEQRPRAPQ